jgi:small nuclear ribonucleoprotein D3
MSIGVPVKVFHEAVGHIVTIETTMGELYRGKLLDAEDNMNCLMGNLTVTYRDGRTAQLEHVFIRGSKIRFAILPDMIKNAPMFKNIKGVKAAKGQGKAAIIKASVNKTAAGGSGGGFGGPGAGAPGGRGGPGGSTRGGRGGQNSGPPAGRGNVYQKK